MEEQQQEESGWKYNPQDDEARSSQSIPKANNTTVSWTASEYMDHHRGAEWYILLVAATTMIAVLIYVITKEYFATAVIVIVGVVVALSSRHKPTQMSYEIGSTGIKFGEKLYTFAQFKSFAIVKDGALSSVSLTPAKRLMPPITAYYAPADEEKIVTALGDHLPYEEKQLDGIDRLSRRLKF